MQLNDILPNEKATYHCGSVCVIGDVHGCADEFERLLENVSYYYGGAIYQVGDLIDRGPYLLRVFQLAKHFNVRLIMGNHESAFYNEVLGGKPCKSEARLVTHEKFASLKPRHQDMIIEMIAGSRNFQKIRLDDDREFTITHAPLVKKFEHEYNGSSVMYCSSREGMEKSSIVQNNVHGHMHWEYKDIYGQIANINQVAYNVDSGCVYGGKLTSLELQSMTAFQVQAEKIYFVDDHKIELN